jgi:hypothetical protein
MSTKAPSTNPISKLAQSIVNLLTAVDTTVNMVNRAVNSADQYVQTVERHAEDYNYSSKLVSLKRREQLEIELKLITPEQRKLMDSEDIFADVHPTVN